MTVVKVQENAYKRPMRLGASVSRRPHGKSEFLPRKKILFLENKAKNSLR